MKTRFPVMTQGVCGPSCHVFLLKTALNETIFVSFCWNWKLQWNKKYKETVALFEDELRNSYWNFMYAKFEIWDYFSFSLQLSNLSNLYVPFFVITHWLVDWLKCCSHRCGTEIPLSRTVKLFIYWLTDWMILTRFAWFFPAPSTFYKTAPIKLPVFCQ